MLTEDQIHRINQLARKAREEGLSEDEKAEQHHLRSMYVAAVKRSLKTHLDYIRPEHNPDAAPPEAPSQS